MHTGPCFQSLPMIEIQSITFLLIIDRLKNIATPANDGLLNNVVWALSNFCRGKPQPKLALVEPAIPYLAQLLSSDKTGVFPDVCWALSYISDGDDSRITAVMNTGVTGKLIENLSHNDASIVTPTLRTLGNFVSGSEAQTQAVVNFGILDNVQKLLHHPKKNIRKETCWLLSNIAAGSRDQISAVVCQAQIMKAIIGLVEKAEWDVRKEATWVISNIATGGLASHVHDLVELGAISALCSVIDVADIKILMIVLEAIECILRVGKNSERDYVGYVDECDGLDKIENLQEHENDKIYKKSVDIIETFFGVEEGEDENLVPAINGDTYEFGLPVNNKTMVVGETQQQPLQPFNF
jgi:importin subunit alpha-1